MEKIRKEEERRNKRWSIKNCLIASKASLLRTSTVTFSLYISYISCMLWSRRAPINVQ